MQTRETPHGGWRSCFDVVSRKHEGWLATLEVSNDGVQERCELPLKNVELSSPVGDSEAVAIEFGNDVAESIKHSIIEPTHVSLVQTAGGADAALEIEVG
ncbi:MAG: hypothetical protein ABR555_00640 [Pyrinomonadaceae bacterium]